MGEEEGDTAFGVGADDVADHYGRDVETTVRNGDCIIVRKAPWGAANARRQDIFKGEGAIGGGGDIESECHVHTTKEIGGGGQLERTQVGTGQTGPNVGIG